MYIVGIDIAKRNHEAIIIDDSGNIIKKAFKFKNDISSFKILMDSIKSISSLQSDFIIGMESTGHYWLALYSNLRKQNYNVMS